MAVWLTTLTRKHSHWLLSAPAIFWLVVFFIAPLFIVTFMSLMSRGTGGLPVMPLTTTHYERVFTTFSGVLNRSLWLSFLAMSITLLIGYPMAFYIRTRTHSWVKNIALFLVILPFWTNFLVRTYAWRFILGREGVINNFLMDANLISEPLVLLNTEFAVLVGLVYGFLPFMVLPIYASIERFDFKFVEAAQDLGASNWSVFWRVMLPMTLPGVLAGCVLVFIPSIGSYVTSDLLGGTQGLMIGNLLAGQFKASGNFPLGAALSVVILSLVVIPIAFYLRFGGREA